MALSLDIVIEIKGSMQSKYIKIRYIIISPLHNSCILSYIIIKG